MPPQVLERRSWQGLDEVVRLLNCSELAFAGARLGQRAERAAGAGGWPGARCQ